jgi:endonuclease-3
VSPQTAAKTADFGELSNYFSDIDNWRYIAITLIDRGTMSANAGYRQQLITILSGGTVSKSVARSQLTLSEILNRLEKFYGPQEPSFPVDPYEFLVWWYCGYPASDVACSKGWDSLTRVVGIDPHELLRASPTKLAAALKPGGMVPELRAQRLHELAFRVENEFGGDLRAALVGPVPSARKLLKSFHGIADPGADRILLFAGLSPVAAVPSNCTGVLLRILQGTEGKNYSANYREEQSIIANELPETLDARARAYLLLKNHGQQLCKRTNPKCTECPLMPHCAYAGSVPRA